MVATKPNTCGHKRQTMLIKQPSEKLDALSVKSLKSVVTPAALEEPSAYLETAIMEMMKKIMEAVTHLMKSFKKKKHRRFDYLAFFFVFNAAEKERQTSGVSHRQRPAETFEPLVEFGGIGEEQEGGSQELQQGDGDEGRRCRRRETHERDEAESLKGRKQMSFTFICC